MTHTDLQQLAECKAYNIIINNNNSFNYLIKSNLGCFKTGLKHYDGVKKTFS